MLLRRNQKSDYLERIGVDDSVGVDLFSLKKLHTCHLDSIPFENLDIHLGVPIVLELDSIVEKITTGRRGGFCYELNSAFAALLRTIGFRVELLEARVFADGELGLAFDHLCLKVQLESTWLCDVGFGHCFRYPIKWGVSEIQSDPSGVFQFKIPQEEPLTYDLYENSTAIYRISRPSRKLEDFAEMCRYHQTSKDSPFTKNSVCSMPTEQGRVTLKGRRLTERKGDQKEQRIIHDDLELMEIYRNRFDIHLNSLPK